MVAEEDTDKTVLSNLLIHPSPKDDSEFEENMLFKEYYSKDGGMLSCEPCKYFQLLLNSTKAKVNTIKGELSVKSRGSKSLDTNLFDLESDPEI